MQSKNVPEVYYPNFLPPFSDGFQTRYLQIYISPKPFFENSYNSASHLKIPVALEVVHYNMLYLVSFAFYCTLFHMCIFYSITEVINLKYFSLLQYSVCLISCSILYLLPSFACYFMYTYFTSQLEYFLKVDIYYIVWYYLTLFLFLFYFDVTLCFYVLLQFYNGKHLTQFHTTVERINGHKVF